MLPQEALLALGGPSAGKLAGWSWASVFSEAVVSYSMKSIRDKVRPWRRPATPQRAGPGGCAAGPTRRPRQGGFKKLEPEIAYHFDTPYDLIRCTRNLEVRPLCNKPSVKRRDQVPASPLTSAEPLRGRSTTRRGKGSRGRRCEMQLMGRRRTASLRGAPGAAVLGFGAPPKLLVRAGHWRNHHGHCVECVQGLRMG